MTYPTFPTFSDDDLPRFITDPIPTPEEIEAIQAGHRARHAEELRRRHAPDVNAARAAAEESLRTQRWAWTLRANVEQAERYLARGEDLSLDSAKRLRELTKGANRVVARALQAATVPYEPEVARAGDSSVRAAAREGVAFMTRLDSDWSQDRNREGWGRATTVMGHVLDTLGELSVSQASHALRVLRVHRRQLPPALAARLFDGAPEASR
ncbi:MULTISPECIES: hypothetical protein [Methylorubrum]|uniref:Uncharacterized protein n=2 Tax=Methylorubrum TaxID=2282523 RepID=C5B1U7_METEA|nr:MULTISPECIES: hypothetical protein [Methylorubrum]MBY0138893.1 hypothetical protein [Methylorubrum populi]ACS39731.1 Hypothetical protein MexAM1_META1p1919 [Methylorubrum extorquens AM1]MBK3404433.1 hypothetical protein [Methylorubrum rhodesianum]MCP1542128.1 hypothetical protein [Methylorubrum extorquens]MCP1590527.1 hypothetical protein [Methylorubrum extorquens]